MEERKCRVSVNGEIREYPVGTAYQTIAEDYQSCYEHQIVLVFVGNNHLQELRKSVENDCEIRFVTTGDAIGHATYKRSMCFLLVKAVHDVAGHDKIERVRIHFSVDKGYYCTAEGDVKVTEGFLEKVSAPHETAFRG